MVTLANEYKLCAVIWEVASLAEGPDVFLPSALPYITCQEIYSFENQFSFIVGGLFNSLLHTSSAAALLEEILESEIPDNCFPSLPYGLRDTGKILQGEAFFLLK